MSTSLIYKCDYITVGVDFYSLYKWPEVDKEQKLVDGKIKYFRIGLKSYVKKKEDTDEYFLKNICDINISYVKKGDKKLSLYKTNILDIYYYLIKYHDEHEILNYLKKICNKFYKPTIKRKVIVEDILENVIINNNNKRELIIEKKIDIPIKIKIIEINPNPPMIKIKTNLLSIDLYIYIINSIVKKVKPPKYSVKMHYSFCDFYRFCILNLFSYYNYNILYIYYTFLIILRVFTWLIYIFFNIT